MPCRPLRLEVICPRCINFYVLMSTCAHTCTLRVHTHVCTDTRTCTHACGHTCAHTRTHAHKHTHMHAHAHTCTHAHTHVQTHMGARAHTHIHICTHASSACHALMQMCAQVNELTYIIKQDIQLLNTSLVDLQRLSAKGRNESNKQSQDHSHTVVDSLRSRLKDATQVRSGSAKNGRHPRAHQAQRCHPLVIRTWQPQSPRFTHVCDLHMCACNRACAHTHTRARAHTHTHAHTQLRMIK